MLTQNKIDMYDLYYKFSLNDKCNGYGECGECDKCCKNKGNLNNIFFSEDENILINNKPNNTFSTNLIVEKYNVKKTGNVLIGHTLIKKKGKLSVDSKYKYRYFLVNKKIFSIRQIYHNKPNKPNKKFNLKIKNMKSFTLIQEKIRNGKNYNENNISIKIKFGYYTIYIKGNDKRETIFIYNFFLNNYLF